MQRLLHNHNKKVTKQERDLCCFLPEKKEQCAYRQANELRLSSFFISTTLLSFEQLIHLEYFTWRRVGWWRDGFLVASWLVAKLPGGEMTADTVTRDRDNKARTHMMPIYFPFTRRVLTLSKTRPSPDVGKC